MTRKTTAKERKTYPEYVLITKEENVINENEVKSITRITENSLLHLFEISRTEANKLGKEDGKIEVWQKSNEAGRNGLPFYTKVFHALKSVDKNMALIIPCCKPQVGYLKEQYGEFNSSTFIQNLNNPIVERMGG